MRKIIRKTAAALLSVLMLASAPVPAVSAAEKITYQYPLSDVRMSAGWSDSLFSHSAEEYDHDLAKASMALALSAMTSSEARDQYTSDKTDPPRDSELKAMLKSMGFSEKDYYSYRYDKTLADDSDEAAFGISHKILTDGGKTTELVAVAVRGGGYGAEWASNFRVGKGRYSSGFYKAGSKVQKAVDDYCSKYNIGKDAKIWITGYSRAAAVTQTTAVCLAKAGYDEKNIYAYAFASPTVVRKGESHANIHNIVNPFDPVCAVPVPDWGFDRAGVTHVIDTSVATDKSTAGRFRGIYKKLTGKSYTVDRRAADMPAMMCDIFTDMAANPSEYVDNGTESTFVFIMQEINSTSELSTDDLDMNSLLRKALTSGVKLNIQKDSMEKFTSAEWLSGLFMQHDPAVYISYMYAADADRCFASGNIGKTVIVDGDADIKVYKGEKLVCSVKDGSVKGNSILVDASQDRTRIYLHGSDEYTVKITGQGTVGYSVRTRKDNRPVGTVKTSFSAADGKVYTGTIPMDEDAPSSAYRLS